MSLARDRYIGATLGQRRPPEHVSEPAGTAGNQARLSDLGLGSSGPSAGPDDAWVQELLQVAPPDGGADGGWQGVQQRVAQKAAGDGAGSGHPLQAELAALQAALAGGQTAGLAQAAHDLAEQARRSLRAGGDRAALQAVIDGAGALWSDARQSEVQARMGQLGIGERGQRDLDRMAAAASRPWYGGPRGQCYRAVAGAETSSYVNRAGGRWAQLADRIPASHTQWAVSFAHWLQETRHGQRAAQELGFEILESDGKTRLGDYLAAHPELKGAVVVVPYGQQGTASRDFDAARAYGHAKWGAGVGDISVVTSIGKQGITTVADGPVAHERATMWWIVYPK